MMESPSDAALMPVLQSASDEELDLIVACIKRKLTQRFTASEAYRDYHEAVDKAPFRQAYLERMARSICNLGGHVLANVARGFHGPSYEAIVQADARRLRLSYPKGTPLARLELAILGTELARVWRRFKPAERDAWMLQQMLRWAEQEGIDAEQLARLSVYLEEQPQQLALDDLLDGLKLFCLKELPDGKTCYLRLVQYAFSCILVRLQPTGLGLEFYPQPQRPRGVSFTLFELLGDGVPRTVSRPRLLSQVRLWLRAPASPMPTASHDPNSGLWRFLASLVQLQPNAFVASSFALPLVPSLAAATAGTAIALATRPADRIVRPLVVMIACLRLRG